MTRVMDIIFIFRIQLAGTRREVGPFLLAAFVFPAAMYLFTNGVAGVEALPEARRVRFLAGSIVFSLSLTSISWLGYLLLENRFMGRLKLFATLPLAPSSYVFGVLLFGIAQAILGISVLITLARALGVQMHPGLLPLSATVILTMLCFCGLSVIVAARARSFSEGSLMTDTLGAGLVLVAPVYYSPDAIPHSVRLVSQWLPTSLAAHAAQAALVGNYSLPDLIALAFMAVVSLSIGFKFMQFREN